MLVLFYFPPFFFARGCGGGGGGGGLKVVSDLFSMGSSPLLVRVVMAAVSERGRTPVRLRMLMEIRPSSPGGTILGGSPVGASVILVGGGIVVGRVLVAVAASGGGGI